MHVAYQGFGDEAGAEGAAVAVESWVSVSAECQKRAGEARYCAAELPDGDIRQWVFWHGHETELKIENGELKIIGSCCCKIPTTNREFWVAKIRRNKERDQENYRVLQENGWQVIVVWECQLTPKKLEHTMREVELLLNENMLSLYRHKPIPYNTEEEEQMPMAAEKPE